MMVRDPWLLREDIVKAFKIWQTELSYTSSAQEAKCLFKLSLLCYRLGCRIEENNKKANAMNEQREQEEQYKQAREELNRKATMANPFDKVRNEDWRDEWPNVGEYNK
jgi:hypothetical protein